MVFVDDVGYVIGVETHAGGLALVDERSQPSRWRWRTFRNERAGHRRAARLGQAAGAGGATLRRSRARAGSGHGLALYLVERGEDVRDVRGHMTERERGRAARPGQERPSGRVRDRPGHGARRAGAGPARRVWIATLKLLLRLPRAAAFASARRAQNRLHADLVTLHPGYEQQVPSLASAGLPRRRPSGVLARDGSVQAALARRRIERIRGARPRALGGSSGRSGGWCATFAPSLARAGRRRPSCSRRASSARSETSSGSPAAATSPRSTAPPPSPPPRAQRQRHRLEPRRQPPPEPGDPHDGAHAGAAWTRAPARTSPDGWPRGAPGATPSRALKRHLSDVVYQQLRRDADSWRPPETRMHASLEVGLT